MEYRRRHRQPIPGHRRHHAIRRRCRADRQGSVRTGAHLQPILQRIADAQDLANGKKVYEHVADLVESWGAETIGKYGYSRVGAVVGATHPEEGKALRKRMPHTFFLVPGYGAQGGTAADVRGMFDADGSGAIVNSSRGIIGAWEEERQIQRDDERLRGAVPNWSVRPRRPRRSTCAII